MTLLMIGLILKYPDTYESLVSFQWGLQALIIILFWILAMIYSQILYVEYNFILYKRKEFKEENDDYDFDISAWT